MADNIDALILDNLGDIHDCISNATYVSDTLLVTAIGNLQSTIKRLADKLAKHPSYNDVITNLRNNASEIRRLNVKVFRNNYTAIDKMQELSTLIKEDHDDDETITNDDLLPPSPTGTTHPNSCVKCGRWSSHFDDYNRDCDSIGKNCLTVGNKQVKYKDIKFDGHRDRKDSDDAHDDISEFLDETGLDNLDNALEA